MKRLILGPPIDGWCFFDRETRTPVPPETLNLSAEGTRMMERFLDLFDPEDPSLGSIALQDRRRYQEIFSVREGATYWRDLRRALGETIHLSWHNSKTGQVFEPEAQRIRAPGGRLVSVGYWADSSASSKFPHPSRLVDAKWEADRRPLVVRFLKSAPRQAAYFGRSHCRFDCGAPGTEMGDAEFSDGTWYWPEGLAHYVECHFVRLPQEFLNHMESQQFMPPADLAENQFSSADAQTEFWIEWGARNSASP